MNGANLSYDSPLKEISNEIGWSTKQMKHAGIKSETIRKGGYAIIFAIVMVSTISAAETIPITNAQQQNDVNWEQLCIQYGGLVGIHTPCSELAHGSTLTQKGRSALGCLFGGGTLLLLGVDPTTVAMIGKAAREVCP